MLHRRPDYQDQVARRFEFEAAHPQVQIMRIDTAWQGIIPIADGEDVITRYELRDLLDALEQRTARQPASAP